MESLSLIALILVVVGGLNWGLVGLLGLDLVATLFGAVSVITKLVYILVGVSAVYVAAVMLPKELK